MNPSDHDLGAELDGFPYRPDHGAADGTDPLETVLSECLQQCRQGQPVDVEYYAQKFPQIAGRIREMVPMVAAMENWKVRKETEILRGELSKDFLPDRIGQCEIRRKIGSGGMGIVFDGFHHRMRRRVAVKMLPTRLTRGSTLHRRFEQEARTVSKLSHRHIVPVLEYGEHDGYCYYVMPFVESVGLDWIIRRLRESEGVVYADEITDFHNTLPPVVSKETPGGLPDKPVQQAEDNITPDRPTGDAGRRVARNAWKQLVRIGLQVADALNYAHKQRTLHRDIKPANLLLDKHGHVWITDFGLAVSTEGADNGAATEISGTLRYMAPERLEGRCDVRSDVYSLGVTLFELLTLEPLFAATGRDDLIQSIRAGSPPILSSKQTAIPSTLDRIVSKALEPLPDRRYQTAGQLQADLLRFLNNQPVSAGQPNQPRRLFGWVRRLRRGG